MNLLKMHNTRTIMAVITCMAAMRAWSQPDWSVNPAAFEYIMTVTGIARIECAESLDPNDMIAAFVGNEVRGVRYFDEFFNGQFLSYLIVYDNDFSGNDVHFKIYDASEDMVFDVLETISFQSNSSHGNSETPFVFHTTAGINEVVSDSYQLPADLKAQERVTSFTSYTETGEVTEAVYSFVNDSHGKDNHYFSLDGNHLVLNVDASTIEDDALDLHLIATPVSGCAFDYIFQMMRSETTSTGKVTVSGSHMVDVYPNPTDGNIQWISPESFAKMVVYDLQGKVALQKEIQGEGSADLSSLLTGTYLVKFLSSGKIRSAIVIRN